MPKTLDYGEGVGEPSPQQLDRGRRFGAWFRAAVAGSGKNIPALADSINVSRQSLYAFRDDCIGGDGRFRKPSERMIRKIADATNAVAADGLRAMGYDPGSPSPAVPSDIANLPPNVQQALAQAVRALREETPGENQAQQLQRVIEPESMQVLDDYEGLPEPLRENARRHLADLKRIAGEAYGKRTDIIGKRADHDEIPTRLHDSSDEDDEGGE